MIKIIKVNIIFLLMFGVGLSSCDKSKDMDSVGGKETAKNLGTAEGTLPKNGEPCADVESISGEPLKVLVHFQWSPAEFADNYDIRIFESLSEIYIETLKSSETTVELERGRSYSWSVTAKKGDAKTVSNTFSFTTPGEPIGNYVPYAAVITVEFNTATFEMDVSWKGSDEDGDSLTYDVVVKEDGDILVEFTNLNVDSLKSISFIPAATYSIEVICRDHLGNYSISRYIDTAPN